MGDAKTRNFAVYENAGPGTVRYQINYCNDSGSMYTLCDALMSATEASTYLVLVHNGQDAGRNLSRHYQTEEENVLKSQTP